MTKKKPRGRPRSPMSERVQIRMSPEERKAWTELAYADGLHLSEWLRAAAVEKARR